MNARYEDLVEEGLDAVMSGRVDLDAFLASHPAEADELRPVLEAAIAVDQSMDVQPRPAFRYVARADFADRVQARSRGSWFSGWLFALRPVAIGLFAVMLATSLAAGGAVAASADATPDNPLYGVKMAQESVRLAIARDELERAGLRARFAERRVDELGRVSPDSPPDQRAHLAQEIAGNLQAVAVAVQHEQQQGRMSPDTRAKLTRLARQLESSRLRDPELLRRVLAETPPEHRPMITRLIRQAQEEHQRTLQNLEAEAGNPGRTPPDSRSVPDRRAPDARPTPDQRASDGRTLPGQRSPDERPTPERRPLDARPTPERRLPGARAVPDGSAPGAVLPPDSRAPDAQPALEQTLQNGQAAAERSLSDAPAAPDRAVPEVEPTTEPTPVEARPAPGQLGPGLQPSPTESGASLAPAQTTPQPQPTPSPSLQDLRPIGDQTARTVLPSPVRTPAPTVRPTLERLAPAVATPVVIRP